MASWPINKRVRGRPAGPPPAVVGGRAGQAAPAGPTATGTGTAVATAAAPRAAPSGGNGRSGERQSGGNNPNGRSSSNGQRKAQGGGRAAASALPAGLRAGGGGGGGNRSQSRSGSRQRSGAAAVVGRTGATPSRWRRSRWLPTLGAPQVFPAEVAANRRRAITLVRAGGRAPCAAARRARRRSRVSIIGGVVVFVVAGAAVMFGLWRLAPSFALNRIGAVPIDEHDEPRLSNVTEGLCATFGLSMPSLYVLRRRRAQRLRARPRHAALRPGRDDRAPAPARSD